MHLATENGFLFFGWNRKKILEYILGNANVHSSPPHSLGCTDRKLNLRMGKGLFFFFLVSFAGSGSASCLVHCRRPESIRMNEYKENSRAKSTIPVPFLCPCTNHLTCMQGQGCPSSGGGRSRMHTHTGMCACTYTHG